MNKECYSWNTDFQLYRLSVAVKDKFSNRDTTVAVYLDFASAMDRRPAGQFNHSVPVSLKNCFWNWNNSISSSTTSLESGEFC